MDKSIKRVLYGNLVYKPSDVVASGQYVLINLYSFRRQLLSEAELLLLNSSYEHFSNDQPISEEEKALYNKLLEKKQILNDSVKKQYDNERKQLLDKQIAQLSPLINAISITPSYACNFNCIYCYQRGFSNKQHVMTKNDVDQVIRYIQYVNGRENYKVDIRSIGINGGETLLPQNLPLLEYIMSKFREDADWNLLTNGSTILNVKDKIDLRRFSKIQVSLDGDRDLFHSVNQVSSTLYDQVIEGIKYLASVCKKVSISCVVTRQLIDKIDSFYRQLSEAGIFEMEGVSVGLVCPSDFAKSSIDESFLSLREWSAFYQILCEKGYTEHLDVTPVIELRHFHRFCFASSTKDLWISEFSCGILENRHLMFSPDGNVYWCVCGQQNKGIIGQYRNPTSKDISEIKRYINRNIHNMRKCSACDLKYVCTGGCPVYSVTKHDDPMVGECGLFENVGFMERLEEYIW